MSKIDAKRRVITVTDVRQLRPIIFHEKPTSTAVVTQPTEYFALNGCHLEFSTPNNISLFVSIASRETAVAKKLYGSLIGSKVSAGAKTIQFRGRNLTRLYNYLEHVQSGIVAIYTAIESLSNVAIPSTYRLEIKNNKGVTEVWDKAAIERWHKTSEKIGTIVPQILGVQSPKELRVWAPFKQLEEIRNEIVHQKTTNSKTPQVDSHFLRKLLAPDIFDKVSAGFSLIRYFCLQDTAHTFFPLGFATSHIKAEEVEDIDNVLSVIPR